MTEESDKAYRKLSRDLAASIIQEMAKSDTSFEHIATRVRIPYPELIEKFIKLSNGIKFKDSLDFISDVLLAMGAEPAWNIKHKEAL